MTDRPLWRVKVACVNADGEHVISNQFVYMSDERMAEVAAIQRTRDMGAISIDRVVEIKRGRFVSNDDELQQARALITYHDEAWSEGFSAACAKHGIEDDEGAPVKS